MIKRIRSRLRVRRTLRQIQAYGGPPTLVDRIRSYTG